MGGTLSRTVRWEGMDWDRYFETRTKYMDG